MKADKQIFFNLNMSQKEAEKLLMLVDAVESSDMPDWAKRIADNVARELKQAGVK